MYRLNDAVGEPLRKLYQLKDLLGADWTLDAIARAMSNDELEDILRFIYRTIDVDYDEEFTSDINDSLIPPDKPDNTLTGEGRIAFARPVVYRDFLIHKTTDGLYDVYDRGLTIYGVRYKTVEEAKKDIDEYIEKYGKPDPDLLTSEEPDEDELSEEGAPSKVNEEGNIKAGKGKPFVKKELMSGKFPVEKVGKPIMKAGYKIQKYSDGRIVVTHGGESNKEMGRQTVFTEFETPQEVLEYLLKQKAAK